jgi:hypothetical protein
VGPHQVRVKLPEGVRGRSVQCLVSNARPALAVKQNWAIFDLKSVSDHEVIVIS